MAWIYGHIMASYTISAALQNFFHRKFSELKLMLLARDVPIKTDRDL